MNTSPSSCFCPGTLPCFGNELPGALLVDAPRLDWRLTDTPRLCSPRILDGGVLGEEVDLGGVGGQLFSSSKLFCLNCFRSFCKEGWLSWTWYWQLRGIVHVILKNFYQFNFKILSNHPYNTDRTLIDLESLLLIGLLFASPNIKDSLFVWCCFAAWELEAGLAHCNSLTANLDKD